MGQKGVGNPGVQTQQGARTIFPRINLQVAKPVTEEDRKIARQIKARVMARRGILQEEQEA